MPKVKLTIQEIVDDFERLVRYDENLEVMFDSHSADEDTIEDFFCFIEKMTDKYLPTYKRHVPKEYFLDCSSTYDKALMLYNILYENFREIFYKLV